MIVWLCTGKIEINILIIDLDIIFTYNGVYEIRLKTFDR